MTEMPFDARRALLADHETHASKWRSVSLVTALREFLVRDPDGVIPDAHKHCTLLSRCAAELTRRGLDGISLIRYGLLPEVVAGVLGPFIGSKFDADALESLGPNTLTRVRLEAWTGLLDQALENSDLDDKSVRSEDLNVREQCLTALVGPLMHWAVNAPLDDLISMRAPVSLPSANDVSQSLNSLDRDLLHQYRWAVDRFSITRLADWRDESLHLEYRWVTGQPVAPPCAHSMMEDQSHSLSAVESEIAIRATQESRPAAVSELSTSLSGKMQSQASQLLQNGKFEAAAALFEFAVSQNPDDANALNNLGFCLLPIDPDRAWQALSASDRLGYQPYPVNLYNRVLCLALLGDEVDALRLADDEWDVVGTAEVGLATLWTLADTGDSSLELVDRVRPAFQLAELARILAQRAGKVSDIEAWTLRAAA